MSNGAVNTPRKKTLLDDYRQPHPATKDPLPGGKYPAQGMWQQKNNGTIVFKINDGVFEKGQKNNPKEVDMNYVDRGALFEAILEATNDANFGVKQIPIAKRQYIFAGGQSKLSDNPIVQATFTVMRTKEGVITVGYSKGDYKAQLIFKGANFTTVYYKNDAGEKVEDIGMMSRWAARTWVRFHADLLDEMERNGWEPPKPRDGGNGGGGNNYGGGNGGGRNNNAGYDDNGTDDIDDMF